MIECFYIFDFYLRKFYNLNDMKQKHLDHYWQKHLDDLDKENSADVYFINKLKRQIKPELFDLKNDFFVNPLINDEEIFPAEGQIAIDVFQTEDKLFIIATLAGVDADDLDILLDNDVLTIRGERHKDDKYQFAKEYFYQECYWGKFSRSIVLPVPVDPKKIDAKIKNGILTITLTKLFHEQSIKINVKNE